MAIGYNWAEGSYADSSWATTAWRDLAILFTPVIERTHIIAFSNRTQGVI
jgi:hypothetical protein